MTDKIRLRFLNWLFKSSKFRGKTLKIFFITRYAVFDLSIRLKTWLQQEDNAALGLSSKRSTASLLGKPTSTTALLPTCSHYNVQFQLRGQFNFIVILEAEIYGAVELYSLILSL